jgi:hypothetical protein
MNMQWISGKVNSLGVTNLPAISILTDPRGLVRVRTMITGLGNSCYIGGGSFVQGWSRDASCFLFCFLFFYFFFSFFAWSFTYFDCILEASSRGKMRETGLTEKKPITGKKPWRGNDWRSGGCDI